MRNSEILLYSFILSNYCTYLNVNRVNSLGPTHAEEGTRIMSKLDNSYNVEDDMTRTIRKQKRNVKETEQGERGTSVLFLGVPVG